ncbi:MAG: hypothetical protein ACOX16_02540 [Candidatus Izemoplasmatales bacterium]|jgi:hypothetical protein
MGNLFDLFLKGYLTVIILYVSINATFRYHAVVRMTLLGAIVLVSFASYFFIGSRFYVAYVIIVGVIALMTLMVRLYLAKRKQDLFVLISIIDKDPIPDTETIREMCRSLGGNPDNISFLGQGSSIMLIKNEPRTLVKKIQKQLEDFFEKKTRRFGLVQYFHIIIALILIASIWRF